MTLGLRALRSLGGHWKELPAVRGLRRIEGRLPYDIFVLHEQMQGSLFGTVEVQWNISRNGVWVGITDDPVKAVKDALNGQ